MRRGVEAGGRPAKLTGPLVVLMAVSAGLAVASNYYVQPLLPAIASDLHCSTTTASLVVTAAQIGYAVGLIFLLPLGDLLARRPLLVGLALGTAAALIVMGSAPSTAVLLPAALVVGVLSVFAQITVALSASLAEDQVRGRVVGTVMTGLLIGILLARTCAGLIASIASWRTVYFVAAVAMTLLAFVLSRRLPDVPTSTDVSYRRLVGSVARLPFEEPVLRRRSLYGALSFGGFGAFWSTMAFLLAAGFHLSTVMIGLFGLAGAGGAAAASLAGRRSDRHRTVSTTGIACGLLCASWYLLWAGQSSIPAIVVAVVLLDVAAAGVHITNQGEIYRLRPEARSRLTAAYMVCYFAGGALGSALAATAYHRLGWDGTCLVGGAFAVAMLTLWLAELVVARFRRPVAESEPAPAQP